MQSRWGRWAETRARGRGTGTPGRWRELPISSCPGYFPLTRCRNAFLSWFRSEAAGQARTPPGAVHALHSFRQPFLRAACGTTETEARTPRCSGRGGHRGPQTPPTGTCGRGAPRGDTQRPLPAPVGHRGRASALSTFPRHHPQSIAWGSYCHQPLLRDKRRWGGQRQNWGHSYCLSSCWGPGCVEASKAEAQRGD